MYDLMIKNCRIVDRTGASFYRGDVAVKDGRIAKILREEEGSLRENAGEVLDGRDHYLAPGFIDIHSHSDCKILTYPAGESRILQGVTTEIGGNCGMSPFPWNPAYAKELEGYLRGWWEEEAFPGPRVSDFLRAVKERGHSVNFGVLAGHGSIRLAAMGFSDKKADGRQMELMKKYLKEAMEDGAFGMSGRAGGALLRDEALRWPVCDPYEK